MTYAREICGAQGLPRTGIWFCEDGADECLGFGGLAPVSFPLFQSIRLGAGSSELALSCMAALLDYRGGPACLERRKAEILSAFGQERTKVDFGRGRFVHF